MTWRETHDDEDLDDADDPEPMATLYKKLVLNEEQVESYRFNLAKGDEIVFSFSSDGPIDFKIMAQSQYERWENEEEATVEEEDEAVLARNDSFEAPRAGWWAIAFTTPTKTPQNLSTT